MLSATNEIDAYQAALLRILASPHRLRIVHLLGERPRAVHELSNELELGQVSVSQHLAAMRSVGLVEATRTGRAVQYRLADPEIRVACDLMRGVLVRRFTALADLAVSAGGEAVLAPQPSASVASR